MCGFVVCVCRCFVSGRVVLCVLVVVVVFACLHWLFASLLICVSLWSVVACFVVFLFVCVFVSVYVLCVVVVVVLCVVVCCC